jgi:hypothetical protein
MLCPVETGFAYEHPAHRTQRRQGAGKMGTRSNFDRNCYRNPEFSLAGWKEIYGMYHDLGLLHHLDIEYDASTFDTDPFQPQPDGMGTIFPFWVSNQDPPKEYVGLLYTRPRFFLLFIILQQKNSDIRKRSWTGLWIMAAWEHPPQRHIPFWGWQMQRS